ncbi:MAG TPA: hypothetical protein PK443_02180, partial [bacterium]|nr:hypothetical protein [bacterium]
MSNIPNIKIGLLESGRLINEVLVDELKDVSIGTAFDNTIVVNIEGFYKRFPILQYSEDKYYLNVPKGFGGKLFHGDKALSMEDAKAHPGVSINGDVMTIPLSDNVRVILLFDRHTLLLKIYPSEKTPRKLPREYRGGIFTSDFDFTFFTILIGFLFAYVLIVNSFSNVKYTNGNVSFEKIPERFARLIMDKPDQFKTKKRQDIKERAKPANASVKMADTKKTDSDRKKSGNGSKDKALRNKGVTIASKGRAGGGGVETKKSSSEVVRSAGIIGIIGSRGKGGTVANLFQEGGFSDKLDKALKGVSGLRTGSSIDEAKIKRGSGDASGVDIGSLKTTTGSGLVAFGGSNESGAVNILGEIGGDDVEGAGTMSPAVIAKVLSQHVSAFQYCYNKALKSNPRLSGELKVKFMILISGE